MNTANPRVTDLEIAAGPYTDAYLVMQSVRAAQHGQRVRVTDHGTPVALIIPADHEPGPETLRAFAYGDSVAAIEADALEQAALLYGTDAVLEITHTGTIATGVTHRRGKRFTAWITVRHVTEETDQAGVLNATAAWWEDLLARLGLHFRVTDVSWNNGGIQVRIRTGTPATPGAVATVTRGLIERKLPEIATQIVMPAEAVSVEDGEDGEVILHVRTRTGQQA